MRNHAFAGCGSSEEGEVQRLKPLRGSALAGEVVTAAAEGRI